MNIIISAGGTMGHINPALAIIDEFKKREKNLNVLYIGTHNRMEKDIVPKKNIKYEEIEIYGLSKDIKRDIKNIFCIRESYHKCLKIMRDFKPDVVIGVGGYVTYPVLKAAHKLHVKTVIHEQNSIPGKSNMFISKYADLVLLTFDSSKKYFKNNKRVITSGNPCASNAVASLRIKKESLGFNKDLPLLVIVAGSLGSTSLNNKFKEFFKQEKIENYQVCFITGKSYYDEFIQDCKQIENVKVFPFMDNLPGLLKDSQAVISRAGAGSLTEIMAIHVPSIIVPSPYVANNHQYYNALELKEKNCILLLEEKDVNNDSLKKMINLVLFDKKKREELESNMNLLKTSDSANIIYKEIKKIL